MSDGVHVLDEIAPIEAEWDALVDRARLSPFVRPGWIAAWWSTWGNGRLQLLALRRAGRLCGIIPLSRGRYSLSSTTNEHTPDFGLIAEDADAARRLATALLARPERLIRLSHLERADADGDALREASAEARRLLLVTSVSRAPYVRLGCDWAAYERRLDRKELQGLRRYRRRLEAKGRVTLDFVEGGERLAETLEEGFPIESSGWKAATGTAIVSDPRVRAFYTAIAHWAAARRLLYLSFLRLDGRAVAFKFGLQDAGTYYLLKGGIDPAFAECAPGRLLTHALVERCATAGLVRMELLGTDEPWKRVWARDSRERVRVHAVPASLLGVVQLSALRLYLEHARPLAKRALQMLGKRKKAWRTARHVQTPLPVM